jgi:hypothetical protein
MGFELPVIVRARSRAGTMMRGVRVAIAADHAGFDLKTSLAGDIERLGHQVLDPWRLYYDAADDYPDFAAASGGRSPRGRRTDVC